MGNGFGAGGIGTVMSGKVVRLMTDKGFGFLAGTDGVERFFHRSSCGDFDRLKVGESVEFEEGDDRSGKGPRAENVRRAAQ